MAELNHVSRVELSLLALTGKTIKRALVVETNSVDVNEILIEFTDDTAAVIRCEVVDGIDSTINLDLVGFPQEDEE